MVAVMTGIRVLEVAEHTFVPAAAAILADWGAEVIKVEHVERGDAMRGLGSTAGIPVGGAGVNILLEHANRGKQSIALDLGTPEGLAILYRLAAECDVFLTNKLPAVRRKLSIDLADIRAHNPRIVYVAGSGYGTRGPDVDQGGYDSLAYWARSGNALSVKPPEIDYIPNQPAPALGDSIGAMFIAGGVSAALLHRERTGEATEVDVSLLATGMWAMSAAIFVSANDRCCLLAFSGHRSHERAAYDTDGWCARMFPERIYEAPQAISRLMPPTDLRPSWLQSRKKFWSTLHAWDPNDRVVLLAAKLRPIGESLHAARVYVDSYCGRLMSEVRR